MTVDQLAALLAEESRARVFAAVALGADTPAAVTERAGLTPRQALPALRRLEDQGVVTTGPQGLRVDYGRMRAQARPAVRTEAASDHGTGDEQVESLLRSFIRDGRLVRLPAQWERKKVVLRFVAERTFESGVQYSERDVNEKLRVWCEGGELDHVTLRRYLVDLHHLHRRDGCYWAPGA